MRTRIVILFSFLAMIVMALPAAGAPDNSPVWYEEPFTFEAEFPNPCLGADYVEPWLVEGIFYFHEFENPSGHGHTQDIAWLTAETESGFSMPERMIGVDVENIGPNSDTYVGTGLYQLRNEDGQKLRFQIKIHATVVADEAIVDMFVMDFACLGH